MPTLPPEGPARSPMLHEARQMAEGFGVDVMRYDRARPDYPDALVARVVASSPGLDVLDVGCGTGIAARQFQAAGCSVLGLDPDARMADVARARGLPVEVATFETWQAAGRSFDAVIAAQSWHWVDPAVGAAKAAEVLRPNGRLVIFGHAYEPPAEVAEPFAAAFRQAVPDSPFSHMPAQRPLGIYVAAYQTVGEQLHQTGLFNDPEHWQFEWERTYTRDEWLDLLPTGGASRRCPPTRSPTSSRRSRQPSTRTADASR